MTIVGKADTFSSSGAEKNSEDLLGNQKNKEIQQEVQENKKSEADLKKEVVMSASVEASSTPERAAFANKKKDFEDTMALWNADINNTVLREQVVLHVQHAGKLMQDVVNKEGASAPDGSPLDVVVQRREMREKYELMMEQIGFKNITVTSESGETVPVKDFDDLDSKYEKLIPKETREVIQKTVMGDIGTMAWPSTMDEITKFRGPEGNEYAQKYAELYYNHSLGIKDTSEAEFLGEFAKILKDNGNAVDGSNRDFKKALKQIVKLNKQTKVKLKRARKIMKAAIEYATSQYYLRRAMHVSDHMMQMSANGPDHQHGLPAYGAGDIRGSEEGREVILYAQSVFGEEWESEIGAIIGDKRVQQKLLPPYSSVAVLTPTRGVESGISGEAGTDDETLSTFGDGRVDMMPGSPSEALSWYLHKYNTIDLEGNKKIGVIDTSWSLYLIERWISNKGGSYDLVGALLRTKNPKTGVEYTPEEARKIGQHILKDALRSKSAWRGTIRTKFAYYADNYRSNRAKREGKPGRYAGRTKDDIPKEDMWKLRSMAATDGTAEIFCGSASKDLVRDRFSTLYEDGTAAWNAQHGYKNGLSNPIVGKNLHRIMDEIDGKGTGDAKDRYIGSIYRDGYFAGLPQAAENSFNMFAKDVLGMDGDAAHKLGKVGKYAAVAGMFYAGWKVLGRVWKGGEGGSTSFISRLGRLGVLGGVATLFGDDMKAIVSGGELGKSGISKWIVGLFGLETDVEGSEGFTPVQTLSYVFGDLSTKDTLDMFTYNNKDGIFMLDENAIDKIKKVHPGLKPDQLKTIESMINEPASQLNEHLNLGLKTIGITDKATYDDVKKTQGNKKFGEYINEYTLQSHIVSELDEVGIDLPEALQDEIGVAIQSVSPAERLVIKERLKQIDAYGQYYEAMSVKMNHILTYRADMVSSAGIDVAQVEVIKNGLADTAGLQKNIMDFMLSRDGFDQDSDLDSFENKVADTLFAGDDLMKGIGTDDEPGLLDRLKGYDYMNTYFNLPGVDAIMDDYAASKDWYINRPIGESYAEKLLKIGDHEVFVSIEQGSDDIDGAPTGTKKSSLSFWVPKTDGGRKEWKMQEYNGKEFNVQGLGWNDAGSGKEFTVDQYGDTTPAGVTNTTYEQNIGLNVRMMETIVDNALAETSSFDLGAQDLGSLANIVGSIPIKMEATGNTKP